MKKIFAITCLVCTVCCAKAQSNGAKLQDQIRKYWFVLLTKGPHRDQDSATAAKIQAAHLANINRLYHEGKVKVAGPFVQRTPLEATTATGRAYLFLTVPRRTRLTAY